jgi:hypothetical protein
MSVLNYTKYYRIIKVIGIFAYYSTEKDTSVSLCCYDLFFLGIPAAMIADSNDDLLTTP